MSHFGITHRTALVVAVIVLLAGCGSGTPEAGPEPTEPVTSDSSPAAESTGAESPLPPEEEDPSLSVPTLPVGGNTDVDGVSQCAHANWLAAPIPPGVEVTINSVALDPDGIFALEGDLCGSGDNACANAWTWTSDTQDQECTVAATQVVDSDESVTLVLDGTVTCDSQALCDEFGASDGLFDGSQLGFTAELGLVAPSPSESTSESASESTDGSSG